MSKLVTVVGATGTQGGSVVRALAGSKDYKVRAITRNPDSDAAKTLRSQGVEIVQADTEDVQSLTAAFAGSYAIFAVTNFFETFMQTWDEAESGTVEVRQGTNLAKAAAATATLEHYIWSTLPNSKALSNGENVISFFASKNAVEDYIRADKALLNKTTFLWLGWYSLNINYPLYTPFTVPNSAPDRLFTTLSTPPSTPFFLLGDETVNIGLFAKAVLDQPEKTLPGKYVLGEAERTTAAEVFGLWAGLQGKHAAVATVDSATYNAAWPNWGKLMDGMHRLWHARGEQVFQHADGVVTKEDLGVTGLVGTKAAFARIQQGA